MTLLDREAPPLSPPSRPSPAATPTGVRAWARDLALGMRFAVSGGREGWARTALTALGVGLGVALLFAAAAVPQLLDTRESRTQARETTNASSQKPGRGITDSTFLWAEASTEYRGDPVTGLLLRPEGANAPAPPGVTKIPGPGEMVVSPALRELLGSSEGALLAQRLDGRIVGTVGDAGLVDPGELRFYTGSSTLTVEGAGIRSAGYGVDESTPPFDPLLMVLVILMCVVLLVPVAIFIATAVRFGGDRRDRRLAALRLVGADARTVRRIAAGETLFGAVLGLAVGAALFLMLRQIVGHVRLWGYSAFPSDVSPVPSLALLVLLAVPVAAVVVTQSALSSVAIEPLGVVRNTGLRKRRLWWRLLLPVIGVAILASTGRVDEMTPAVGPFPIVTGASCVLIGLVGLLPWLVEAVVARLRGGPVAWQLAIRRLQLSSGTAARAVSGITVAVAGAIALQMMFGAMQKDFLQLTGQDTERADFYVSSDYGDSALAERMIQDFRETKGVTKVIGTVESYVAGTGSPTEQGWQPITSLTMGTCATLKEIARLPSCRDGDAFVAHLDARAAEKVGSAGVKEQNDRTDAAAVPGEPIDLTGGDGARTAKPALWTLPKSARTVVTFPDPMGDLHDGILVTPGALGSRVLPSTTVRASIKVDPRVPDAAEYVRTTAAHIDPTLRINALKDLERDKQYGSVQTGLLVGGTLTMMLIAASLLVSQIEQLRERKRMLSVLVAFGTRRRTLAWSVLWQTAVPVVLGTGLAIVGGLVLGDFMLGIIGKSIDDWWVFVPYAAVGAAVIMLVTVASMPPLWRMMRPDGLRTE
ncbi:FtsX-like permease family protein [Streptomyces sp. IB2014 016-6]|uniref:FtsX-like permease family protein n=1 Tax=Streptomyces sp. IB2014 016-6 TaxID=2517818 RepID=UPI0011CA949E|nr:FtsX-like permease family protein [Streptomyces sp. IB2014 016-6]TXL84843.1 ABC transporter permease [Streptomyces sp. IB2014 016-6]